MPPNYGVVLPIDVKLGTKPISIPPYRMTLTKVKKSKDKLSSLMENISGYQFDEDRLRMIRDKVFNGETKVVSLNSDGVLSISGRVYMPRVGGWEPIDILNRQTGKLRPKSIDSMNDQNLDNEGYTNTLGAGQRKLTRAEEVISKTEENLVVESTEVAPALEGGSEAVTESSEPLLLWRLPVMKAPKTRRLRVMLTITFSELVSKVRVTQMKPDETLEESGEPLHLRRISRKPLVLFSVMNVDKYRYVAAESFYKPVMGFSPVPDLYIMWLLHLCEAHQEMQSWTEAAQCIVTVAGVVMQVASFGGSNINLSAWEDKKNPSESKEIVDAERLSERERIRMNEALMGLLLRLDSVPGVDPTIRELRRDLSRRIVRLQEILDVVSDTNIQNWDGFLMDWDDVVERMEMDVCKERGGGNELETFCAEHLGFRCLQRFLRDQ
ncbi:BAG family molecular chaperone regulator 5, mitochondrial [Capsicum annuum]|uniref:BAG family molecular chaperone regulator 5, mitochondrial n=1 Tax=Capsicum annuum TaxID=4072 RepID=A0A2G2ZZ65_CAPAN|nr:BAG family molecular chaperone regulator 5, mitochondrial [Capsicum annuum]